MIEAPKDREITLKWDTKTHFLKLPPKEIYLLPPNREWSDARINNEDIKYIRADLINRVKE